ncbi:MAG: hypothetical protein LBR80_04095 [Deltaproteobacteria bacterium]|nr:hypothetical protein [Deltaproteobacteria bacterium]
MQQLKQKTSVSPGPGLAVLAAAAIAALTVAGSAAEARAQTAVNGGVEIRTAGVSVGFRLEVPNAGNHARRDAPPSVGKARHRGQRHGIHPHGDRYLPGKSGVQHRKQHR